MSNHLFELDANGDPLGKVEAEMYYHLTMKLLYLSKRSTLASNVISHLKIQLKHKFESKHFPFTLLQSQGYGQGYGTISHPPVVGIYQSKRLCELIIIFISTFFASIITLTKMGQCYTIYTLCKNYTLLKTCQCQEILLRIANARFL